MNRKAVVETKSLFIHKGKHQKIKKNVIISAENSFYCMELNIIEKHNDFVIISVSGQIDIMYSAPLKHGLMSQVESGSRHFLLDFSQTEYLDSSGVGSLIFVYSALKKINGTMQLAAIPSHVEALLKITKLISFFTIYDTVEEGRQAILGSGI